MRGRLRQLSAKSRRNLRLRRQIGRNAAGLLALLLAAGCEPAPAEFTNRLIHEQSPYLLQHAHNPVNWMPWGPEALAKARRENRPIFLSVGYSTCHWCHVMERESFSQVDVAAALNTNFVAIKVDREERPDVDALYLSAVQAATGSGGWPETTILLPDGRPFYGGTYLPKAELLKLLAAAAEGYRSHRRELTDDAAHLMDAVEKSTDPDDRGAPVDPSLLLPRVIDSLTDRFDRHHGGFGSAPKFPPHSALAVLLASKDPSMALATLDAMARGGIHDQLGGGFHRYSTGDDWNTPHFEKMLYDNALLGQAYASAYRLTHQERYKAIADDTYAWAEREMLDPSGGFRSALDADAAGVEGSTYLWTSQQLTDALGSQDAALVAPGTLHDLDERLRPRLRAARRLRPQPRQDDKVIAGWNGLMIGSLARASHDLGEPHLQELAERAAGFVNVTMIDPDGTLHRDWRDGKLGPPAFQDDYAYLAQGLLELGPRWRVLAERLTATMVSRFWDARHGGFFESDGRDGLLVRMKDPFDSPMPSGNALAAEVLWRLGDKVRARATVNAFAGTLQRTPESVQMLALEAASILESEPVPGATLPTRVKIVASRESNKVTLHLSPPPGWHLSFVAVTAGHGSVLTGPVVYGSRAIRVSMRGRTLRVRYQPCSERACLAAETQIVNLGP